MPRPRLRIGFAAWCCASLAALISNAPTLRADAPTTQPFAQAATQPSDAELQPLVKMLGDPDSSVGDAAQITLLAQPLALPSYEAALNTPGLTDAAKQRLSHIVELLEPGYAARCRRWQDKQDRIARATQADLHAYLSIGHHDPRWDADAEKVISMWVGADFNRDTRKQVSALCHEASDAGCDDPFLLYIQADLDARLGQRGNLALRKAAMVATDAMLKSPYPAIVRAAAAADFLALFSVPSRDGDLERWINTQRLAYAALVLLPEAGKEPIPRRVPIYDVAKLLFAYYKSADNDEKQAYDQVYPVLQESLPNDPLTLDFQGDFFTHYAWSARGDGSADSVSPDQWKIFGARLDVAAQALQKSIRHGPQRPARGGRNAHRRTRPGQRTRRHGDLVWQSHVRRSRRCRSVFRQALLPRAKMVRQRR